MKRFLYQLKHSTIQVNHNKLVKLNGGNIKYPCPVKRYASLTDKTYRQDQEDLFDLGLNCHILSIPKKFEKRLDCEVLLDNLDKLTKKGRITVEPTLKQEVIAKALKTRGHHNFTIIEKRRIDAAKQLKNYSNITIRKADK